MGGTPSAPGLVTGRPLPAPGTRWQTGGRGRWHVAWRQAPRVLPLLPGRQVLGTLPRGRTAPAPALGQWGNLVITSCDQGVNSVPYSIYKPPPPPTPRGAASPSGGHRAFCSAAHLLQGLHLQLPPQPRPFMQDQLLPPLLLRGPSRNPQSSLCHSPGGGSRCEPAPGSSLSSPDSVSD